MAFLYQPVAVKPIPKRAELFTRQGKQYARWPKRGGGTVVAEVVDGKCRVVSPVWWCEYRDAHGRKVRVGVSRDRKAAEHRKAQIILDVERQKGGLPAASARPSDETLSSLASAYEQHLLDMGRVPQHAYDTRRRVVTVATDCGWVTARDVTLTRWVRWVGEARGTKGDGFSAETINHYLRSLRAFFRWLVRSRGLAADPLAGAELLAVEADRRYVRRVLSADEFRKFIDTTRASTRTRCRLDGPARAALYLFAARTGLRSAVLAQLTPESLRLDADTPHVPVEAKRQKSRKALAVPIPSSTLAELRPWLDSRPSNRPLWPGNWCRHGHAARMMRRDLAAAGIPYETADGQYDLHALRSQYITDLALAGVPLQVAQKLAGHSTPALTAKFYVRLGLADLGEAADRLGEPAPKKRRS